MKKQFLFIILLVALIIGGGLFLLNAKPLVSDSSNFSFEVGTTYFIRGDGSQGWYKILALPDSSGWIKAESGASFYYINIHNIFFIQESKKK